MKTKIKEIYKIFGRNASGKMALACVEPLIWREALAIIEEKRPGLTLSTLSADVKSSYPTSSLEEIIEMFK